MLPWAVHNSCFNFCLCLYLDWKSQVEQKIVHWKTKLCATSKVCPYAILCTHHAWYTINWLTERHFEGSIDLFFPGSIITFPCLESDKMLIEKGRGPIISPHTIDICSLNVALSLSVHCNPLWFWPASWHTSAMTAANVTFTTTQCFFSPMLCLHVQYIQVIWPSSPWLHLQKVITLNIVMKQANVAF